MFAPWEIFKLLGDCTRLRLIHLLRREELSVAEIQEILEMGQSRISSHLAILRKAGLLTDRKDGKRTYYSLNENIGKNLLDVISAACQADSDHASFQEDETGLKRVLEKRRRLAESYFNEVAGKLGKTYCPGRSWEAIGHFLLFLTPAIEIADLGAGEGVLAQLMARRAKAVYCIDNSPRMVEVGTELAKKHGFENLFYKLGDIESVPLPDESVDLVLLSQALHHSQYPQVVLGEAQRILRPGGRVSILDLKEHDFERARELYADRWLGFKENTLYQYLVKAGFKQIELNVVSRETEPPFFQTILASASKINGSRSS